MLEVIFLLQNVIWNISRLRFAPNPHRELPLDPAGGLPSFSTLIAHPLKKIMLVPMVGRGQEG